LRAESEEVAKGATFVLDCPCKFVTAGRIPRSDSPHGMTADRPDFYPLRIFVIEDHRDTLEALQISLERSGHVVFSARSKAEAHREIPRANCHVLISDINLPDGNGWDLMQELGKLCPDYAIAISGYGMKADRERSAESGFRHHLVKPVSAQKLDTLLQEATTELKEKEK
jgi:CheY-like chemotaxis protein